MNDVIERQDCRLWNGASNGSRTHYVLTRRRLPFCFGDRTRPLHRVLTCGFWLLRTDYMNVTRLRVLAAVGTIVDRACRRRFNLPHISAPLLQTRI